MKDMKFSDILSENMILGEKLIGPKFQISILSNIVTTQLNEILEYCLRSNQINASVRPGDYDNIVQESGNGENPDLTLIFWEVGNLIDGLQYKIQNFSNELISDLLQKTKSELDMVFENLKSRPRVIINKFSVSLFSDEISHNSALKKLCDDLNEYLVRNIPSSFTLIDIERVFRKITIKNSVDWRYFYSSKALYSVEFYKEYASLILPIILSSVGKSKKVLILDCDNTLWKGILGEDGLNGIEYSSQTKNGVYFEEIQHMVVKLATEGVVVCLVSKNNEVDVLEVFETKKDLVLKNEYIVLKKINWNDKASNIREIAKELNLGLDSFVFVDDSDFEINLVREQIPSVTCFQVPKKLYEYPAMFREMTQHFYKQNTSTEDRSRVELYKQEQARDSEKKSFANMDEYLKSLELKLSIHKNDTSLTERIAQLTQKTNQFNLTTKRYTVPEIESFMKNNDSDVYAFSLVDKFGDYGITGVTIAKKNGEEAMIDTFLMSCRILGRNVEFAFINQLIGDFKKESIKTVVASYAKTEKNNQVSNFYDNLGFEVVSSDDNKRVYKTLINDLKLSPIEYIEVRIGTAS